MPVRVEVGPRDLAEGVATVVCRITGEKAPVALDQLATVVPAELDRQQGALFVEAEQRREANTVDVATLDDAREAAAASGWARVPWSVVGAEGEKELAAASVSVRCLNRADGSVPESDDEPDLVATVARAY